MHWHDHYEMWAATEGDRAVGGAPGFTLFMPEKMTTPFLLNVGQLQAGDTIHVAVGPNTTDGNDDFSIVFNETRNPVPWG